MELRAKARLGGSVPPSPGVFSPAAFGGDPSGVADSSHAIKQAIAAMIAFGNCSSSPSTPCDLRSATLSLAGGEYATSAPIVIPPGYANYNVEGGSLVAMASFPAGEALLTLGSGSGSRGTASNNVAVRRVTLDGKDLVGTGLAVLNGQNADIGPAVLVQGFTGAHGGAAAGILMTGTGAGYIHHSWVGERSPGDASQTNLTATAISLEGDEHDCYVEDVIVWSGLVGIVSVNGANQISGVHVWNLKTTSGGLGIVINGEGKVINSYLDFTPLVVVDPKSVIVSNNLFLAEGNLVVQSHESSTVSGLVVTSNRWWSESKYVNDSVVVDGKFTAVENTVFENNALDSKWQAKSTRATMRQAVSASSNTTIDFADALLFPLVPIDSARCTLYAEHPVAFAISPLPDSTNPLSIRVITAGDVGDNAEIECTVDQSTRLHAAH